MKQLIQLSKVPETIQGHCKLTELQPGSRLLSTSMSKTPQVGGSPSEGSGSLSHLLHTVTRLAECSQSLPVWLSGKESTCPCRRRELDPWYGKIPCRRKRQPTPVFVPGKSHGQRNLVGYGPWGHKRVRHNRATKEQQQQYISLTHPRSQPEGCWEPGWGLTLQLNPLPKHDQSVH